MSVSGSLLDREQLRIRVRAARQVAGLSQEELGRLMKQDGFGIHDPAALERKVTSGTTAREINFHRGRRDSIARHTGFPKSWFTEPDHRKLFGDVSELRDRLQEALDELDRLEGDAGSELESDEELAARQFESSDQHSEEPEHGSQNG